MCAWRNARRLAQARPQTSGGWWLAVLLEGVLGAVAGAGDAPTRLVTGLCTSCPLLCSCPWGTSRERVRVVSRWCAVGRALLRRYWRAAGRCRAVAAGWPRSAGGTWLAAHFAGAKNSNHPHSAARLGRGRRFGKARQDVLVRRLGRMRANLTSGCRRELQRASRLSPWPWPWPWPWPSHLQWPTWALVDDDDDDDGGGTALAQG